MEKIPAHILIAVDSLLSPYNLSMKQLLKIRGPTSEAKRWLTISEAEEYSGLSRWTLGRRVKSGEIKQAKLGSAKSSKVLIEKNSLDRFLESKVEIY